MTVLIIALKKIVNEAWTLNSMDGAKLAKYMRCLFQIALSGNPNIAEELLDSIHQLADEASEVAIRMPRLIERTLTMFNRLIYDTLGKNLNGLLLVRSIMRWTSIATRTTTGLETGRAKRSISLTTALTTVRWRRCCRASCWG